MPRMSDRERLAKLEEEQRRLAQEADTARRAVRTRYVGLIMDLPLETFSEREFHEIVRRSIELGAQRAVAALKESGQR